jgi:hypothetical protein
MNRLSIRCTACLWAIYAALFAQDKTTQDQDWALFRKAYPYHGQAVALSEEYPGRSRTLIVSEPPPHVTLEGLRALSPEVFSNSVVETTKVG